jgi:hypothetical protein
MGNHYGIRSWIPLSTSSVDITEKSRAIGSYISSKKGEIAETPYDITVSDTEFLPFGIKQSVTNSQLLSAGGIDGTVDVLERLLSSIAGGLQIAESTVFAESVFHTASNNGKIVHCRNLDPLSLNAMFRAVECEGWLVDKIVFGPNSHAILRTWGKDMYDEATTREIMTMGLFGHIWTADIHVIPNKSFAHIIGFGHKSEKMVFKQVDTGSTGYTSVDTEKSIIRHACEYVLPTEPLKIEYSFVPHVDAQRSRHVFEVRSSIGVRINNLVGLSVMRIED